MISKKKYVISGHEEGIVIIYDHEKHSEKEIETTKAGIQTPRFIEMLDSEKHLVIGDSSGIAVLEISKG
jgi:hypothetical protein